MVLWAFLDKTFGLGYATEGRDAWLDGGSPTFGSFSLGAAGPFEDFYNSIAGDPWADWLFMLGLLGIDLGLILGVMMRLSAWSGALLLAEMGAGQWFGLGGWWGAGR